MGRRSSVSIWSDRALAFGSRRGGRWLRRDLPFVAVPQIYGWPQYQHSTVLDAGIDFDLDAVIGGSYARNMECASQCQRTRMRYHEPVDSSAYDNIII